MSYLAADSFVRCHLEMGTLIEEANDALVQAKIIGFKFKEKIRNFIIFKKKIKL